MHDKAIVLKKADRGTTSIMMSRENKINKGMREILIINPSLNLWLKTRPEKLSRRPH